LDLSNPLEAHCWLARESSIAILFIIISVTSFDQHGPKKHDYRFLFPLYVIFSNTLPTICSFQQIAGCSLFLPSFFTDQLSSISNEIRKSNNFFDSNHSLVKLCPTLSTSNHFEYLIQTSSHQWGWRGASPLLALLVIFFFINNLLRFYFKNDFLDFSFK